MNCFVAQLKLHIISNADRYLISWICSTFAGMLLSSVMQSVESGAILHILSRSQNGKILRIHSQKECTAHILKCNIKFLSEKKPTNTVYRIAYNELPDW